MLLSELFSRCLSIPYVSVGSSADLALDRTNDTLTIYFQHSRGEQDWQKNLNFPARAYPRSEGIAWYVHRGFLSLWQEIEPYVAALLRQERTRTIAVCGYSHGAALAALCHEYIWYHAPQQRDRLRGYGFGSPRLLWGPRPTQLLQRWEHFTVIRNLDDVVTHLPPRLLGYSHVGKLLEIGQRGAYSAAEAHTAQNILAALKQYENASPPTSAETR